MDLSRGNRYIKINIRVYSQSMPVTHSHGFLVDDFSTGLSPSLGEIQIDARKQTLSSLRPILMYSTGKHMNRRSLLFQEVLFIMSRLPNLYDRPKEDLTEWQYGYVKKNETKVKLIHPDREDQLIVSIVPELYKHDLVIVPLSQIPPALQPTADAVTGPRGEGGEGGEREEGGEGCEGGDYDDEVDGDEMHREEQNKR
jgi:hypothetical protein